MSTVNIPAREIVAKIVYYGPALSGKTSTLQRIYRSVSPKFRGELVSLATSGDRTIFFDFLPIKVEKVNDFAVRLQLYTVPGQVYYNATRKVVLMGADGVVFVADSRPEAMEDNQESLKNLAENLRDHGLDIERVPLVFQYNKRDLPSVMDVSEMEAALNRFTAPSVPSSAMTGQGIIGSLRSITRLVARDMKNRGVLAPGKRPTPVTEFGAGGGSLGTAVTDLDAQSAAGAADASPRAAPSARSFSFQRLWPEGELRSLAGAVEGAIGAADYAGALRSAGSLLSALLQSMPGADEVTRAHHLGLHPRDHLRFSRLLSAPDAADEEDALFALYLCAAAQVRAEELPGVSQVVDGRSGGSAT